MKRVHGVMKIARVLTLIGVFTLLANSQSKAQLLTLPLGQPTQFPDFNVGYVTMQYIASSGIFSATAIADDLSGTYNYLNGNETNEIDWIGADFTLTAYITPAGNLTNGTLTIAGDLNDGNGYTDLLTGTLTTGAEGWAFGATNTPPTADSVEFQFLFTVTGGSLVSDYGGVTAADGYIDLYPNDHNNFNGSWTTSFTEDPNGGYGDVKTIPEPSSFVLLMFAGALCAAANILRRPSRRDPQVVQG